jgi:hypothetical protein
MAPALQAYARNVVVAGGHCDHGAPELTCLVQRGLKGSTLVTGSTGEDAKLARVEQRGAIVVGDDDFEAGAGRWVLSSIPDSKC